MGFMLFILFIWLFATAWGLIYQAWWGYLLLALGFLCSYPFARDSKWRPDLLKKLAAWACLLSLVASGYLGIGALLVGGRVEAAFAAADDQALQRLLRTGSTNHRLHAVNALGEILRRCPENAPGIAPAARHLAVVMTSTSRLHAELQIAAEEAMLNLVDRVVLMPAAPRLVAIIDRAQAKPQGGGTQWRPEGRLLWLSEGVLSEGDFRGMTLDAARKALGEATGLVAVWTTRSQVGVYKRADSPLPEAAPDSGTAYQVTAGAIVVDINSETITAAESISGAEPPKTIRTEQATVGDVVGEGPDFVAWVKALPQK